MRTVTVEELEALADEAHALWKKLIKLPIQSYNVETWIESATEYADETAHHLRKAFNTMTDEIASARSDAEADKADAKRKDV